MRLYNRISLGFPLAMNDFYLLVCSVAVAGALFRQQFASPVLHDLKHFYSMDGSITGQDSQLIHFMLHALETWGVIMPRCVCT